MTKRPSDARGLSLWALIEALQDQFDAKGLEPDAVDAAVVGRVGALMARRSRNDESRIDLSQLLALRPVEV